MKSIIKGVGISVILLLFQNLNPLWAQGNILVYVTYDVSGGGYDKSYFDGNLPAILGDHCYTVTVTDREETLEITNDLLSTYNEIWILSTNDNSLGCFSSEEITTILSFREAGNGILIMADHHEGDFNYQVDANQISIPLGVTFYGITNHGPNSGPIAPDFEAHPLFVDVYTVVGDLTEGNMIVDNPVEVMATYQGDNLIAIFDDGTGRVVFDVSFIRLLDAGYLGYDWILVGETPQYVRNIADWLMPTQDVPTLSEWGMIVLALLILAIGTVAVIRRRRAIVAE